VTTLKIILSLIRAGVNVDLQLGLARWDGGRRGWWDGDGVGSDELAAKPKVQQGTGSATTLPEISLHRRIVTRRPIRSVVAQVSKSGQRRSLSNWAPCQSSSKCSARDAPRSAAPKARCRS